MMFKHSFFRQQMKQQVNGVTTGKDEWENSGSPKKHSNVVEQGVCVCVQNEYSRMYHVPIK